MPRALARTSRPIEERHSTGEFEAAPFWQGGLVPFQACVFLLPGGVYKDVSGDMELFHLLFVLLLGSSRLLVSLFGLVEWGVFVCSLSSFLLWLD